MNGKDCDFEKKEFYCGPIGIRPIHLPKRFDIIEPHDHEFDHACLVLNGSVKATGTNKDGVTWEKDYKKGDMWNVEAFSMHGITALEENTVIYCIFTHRSPDGKIVQEYTGPQSMN